MTKARWDATLPLSVATACCVSSHRMAIYGPCLRSMHGVKQAYGACLLLLVVIHPRRRAVQPQPRAGEFPVAGPRRPHEIEHAHQDAERSD
mmetsp:Transcript_342/g.1138  ORF Transcript_342/g.1138 Transcript_342/m.1138 type:complete len:91 (+) Transcript_342:181-453(+)